MAKRIKAKGTSRSGLPGGLGGGMGGMGGGQAGMMAQLQKMQAEMVAAQEALESETMNVSVGGGAVVVTITGHQRIQAIKIDPASIDLQDEEWLVDLQDLVTSAVNQAIEQSQAMAAERMEGITGGMGGMLPGGLGGLLG